MLEGEFWCVGFELDEERNFAVDAFEDFVEERNLRVVRELWEVGANAADDLATVW